MTLFEVTKIELKDQLLKHFEEDIKKAISEYLIFPRNSNHLLNYYKGIRGEEVPVIQNKQYPMLGRTLRDLLNNEGKNPEEEFIKGRSNSSMRADLAENDQLALVISSFELMLVYAGLISKEIWEESYHIQIEDTPEFKNRFNYISYFPQENQGLQEIK